MAKEAVFTMKLEPELRDAFMAAAKRSDRPASQILRELMRDFVETHEEPNQEYWEFVRRGVERARKDIAEGKVFTDEQVRERMKARFKEWERIKREGAA